MSGAKRFIATSKRARFANEKARIAAGFLFYILDTLRS